MAKDCSTWSATLVRMRPPRRRYDLYTVFHQCCDVCWAVEVTAACRRRCVVHLQGQRVTGMTPPGPNLAPLPANHEHRVSVYDDPMHDRHVFLWLKGVRVPGLRWTRSAPLRRGHTRPSRGSGVARGPSSTRFHANALQHSHACPSLTTATLPERQCLRALDNGGPSPGHRRRAFHAAPRDT